MLSQNTSKVDAPLTGCLDGIDPLHQKFSVKANLAAGLLINVVAIMAINRDRRYITPKITQDDSKTVRNLG